MPWDRSKTHSWKFNGYAIQLKLTDDGWRYIALDKQGKRFAESRSIQELKTIIQVAHKLEN